MGVFAGILFLCDIFINPVRAIIYFFYQHPYIAGSVLLVAGMVKLFYKLMHIPYESNVNMKGKTVLITGAVSGVGKATAFDLAKRNARVLLACRNVEKGNEVAEQIKSATGNRNVIVECLDLSSFESVRQCATRISEREEKLHVLINNESIMGDPRKTTVDGCEIIMQTNHFGHFLLTLLLLDLLKRSIPSRIINVTFNPIYNSKFNVEDLNNERKLEDGHVYYNSKQAISLFTVELSRRLQETGITVNSFDPGLISSDYPDNFARKIVMFLMGSTFEEASQTAIRLAVDPSLENTTGKHFINCTEIFMENLSDLSKDEMLAKRLFELSETTVGVSMRIVRHLQS